MEPDNLTVFGGDPPEFELLKLRAFAQALDLMEGAVFRSGKQTLTRPEGERGCRGNVSGTQGRVVRGGCRR